MSRTLPPSFADVIFPDRIQRPFTYRIPEGLLDRVKVGQWVVVPFGSRLLAGFILSLSDHPPSPRLSSFSKTIELRDIQDLLSTSPEFELEPRLVDLARWMSDYYIAPLSLCLRLIQPPRLPGTISSRIRITPEGLAASTIQRATSHAALLLPYLAKKPKGVTRKTLSHLVQKIDPALNKLKRQGFIQETFEVRPEHETEQSPSSSSLIQSTSPATQPSDGPPSRFSSSLSHVQGSSSEKPLIPPANPMPSWWSTFEEGLALSRFQEFFLSGSGDNHLEYLLHAVEAAIRHGKSSLFICPDISRVSFLAEVLRKQWGDRVGLFHGDLPVSAQHAEWTAMSRGHRTIIVGTRLALFAPLPTLGLICLEDEDDPSLKDEQCPYYHARDVARQRASLSQATFILQSHHPSLETYAHFCVPPNGVDHEAPRTGTIQLVDLRQTPYGTLLSQPMLDGVESALRAGGGIVFYVNRKGFSSCLICRDCGEGLECPDCHVSLHMFRPPPRLVCSYCGHEEAVPVSCPTCSSARLEPAGLGTERVEEVLRTTFPTTTIARLDRNAIRTPQADSAIRTGFCEGTIHILVGTQMLFHGAPLHPIRLVGIPYAESGLHIPDFRAAEHVYQHVQHAVDLLTPGLPNSQVILQTRLPTHHSVTAVVQQAPRIFYEQELAMRQAMGYPPTTQLIQLSVSGMHSDLTQELASQWGTCMTNALTTHFPPSSSPPPFMVLGPLPHKGPRPGRRHHYQMLVKAPPSDRLRHIVRTTLEAVKSQKTAKGMLFGVIVDPVRMT